MLIKVIDSQLSVVSITSEECDKCWDIFSFESINSSGIYDQNISHLNVGTGFDISIGALGEKIKDVVAFAGKIENDLSKPDGMKQKLLDSNRIRNLGWSAKISLDDGLKSVYLNYKNSLES